MTVAMILAGWAAGVVLGWYLHMFHADRKIRSNRPQTVRVSHAQMLRIVGAHGPEDQAAAIREAIDLSEWEAGR